MADVQQFPCKMAGLLDRQGKLIGTPEGSVWYSYGDHGHNVGVSLPAGRKLAGRTEVDENTGQVTIFIYDPTGAPLYVSDSFGPVDAHATAIVKAG